MATGRDFAERTFFILSFYATSARIRSKSLCRLCVDRNLRIASHKCRNQLLCSACRRWGCIDIRFWVYLKRNGFFLLLQKNTYNVTHTNVKYNKLSKGKGSGNRRRINRTTTVAVPSGDANDLMPIIEPTRSEDEDDYEDDEDDDDNDDECVVGI